MRRPRPTRAILRGLRAIIMDHVSGNATATADELADRKAAVAFLQDLVSWYETRELEKTFKE